MNVIQHSFICRPSDSTVSEDARDRTKKLILHMETIYYMQLWKALLCRSCRCICGILVSKTISCHEAPNEVACKNIVYFHEHVFTKIFSVCTPVLIWPLWLKRKKSPLPVLQNVFDTRLVPAASLSTHPFFTACHTLSAPLQISNLQHRPTTIYF
jgi:hypothetical protein